MHGIQPNKKQNNLLERDQEEDEATETKTMTIKTNNNHAEEIVATGNHDKDKKTTTIKEGSMGEAVDSSRGETVSSITIGEAIVTSETTGKGDPGKTEIIREKEEVGEDLEAEEVEGTTEDHREMVKKVSSDLEEVTDRATLIEIKEVTSKETNTTDGITIERNSKHPKVILLLNFCNHPSLHLQYPILQLQSNPKVSNPGLKSVFTLKSAKSL